MHIPRIFQDRSLSIGQVLELSSTACHHLNNVLRCKSGATIILFNGTGGEYIATINEISKRKACVSIESYEPIDNESSLNIHLGQAISRGEKMDFTIQKAVELGVNAITPLFTERCGVKLSTDRIEKRMQHWQAVIISASEQCGRNSIATLHPPRQLSAWLPEQKASTKLILNPHEGTALNQLEPVSHGACLLIGPEGGLSDTEIATAKKHDFLSIKLGPRVLRTETAALVAISIMQSMWGDV